MSITNIPAEAKARAVRIANEIAGLDHQFQSQIAQRNATGDYAATLSAVATNARDNASRIETGPHHAFHGAHDYHIAGVTAHRDPNNPKQLHRDIASLFPQDNGNAKGQARGA